MPSLQQSLAALATVEQSSLFSLNSQSQHRLQIFQSWLTVAQENGYDLESYIVGRQSLDIGCGQGDMIALYAAALKVSGNKESHVLGVDPADLDYGKPWTLGQAQATLSSGPLHEYLSFRQATAPALVASQSEGTYTTAYFAHSLYYFPSRTSLVDTFKALLQAGVQSLLLAEWSLAISKAAALPHLLAVLLQSMDPIPDGNVRTVLSPASYIDAATQAGWELVGARTLTPTEELEDGKWETGFAQLVAKESKTRVDSIKAHADALEASLSSAACSEGVACMDVWTAVLRPANEHSDINQK